MNAYRIRGFAVIELHTALRYVDFCLLPQLNYAEHIFDYICYEGDYDIPKV